MTKASHSNRFHGPRLEHRQTSNWCSIIMTCRTPIDLTWTSLILVQRRRSASTFLFFVAADGYSRPFCEFFCWANVNRSFLRLNQLKITSFSNCFELISFAWQFTSVSSSAGVSLNTSNQDRHEENDPYERRLCYMTCWTLNFCLVIVAWQQLATRQSRSHSLTVCALGVLLLCCQSLQFWKLIFISAKWTKWMAEIMRSFDVFVCQCVCVRAAAGHGS